MKSAFSVAALTLALVWPGLSLAHVHLLKSVPERGAVLSQPPTQVQLWFSGKVAADWSQVVVSDSDGTRVDKLDLKQGEDARHLVESLKALGAGHYTVRFNVVSGDGHRVKESFSFSIQ